MVKIGVVLGSKPTNFSKEKHYCLEVRYFSAIEQAGAEAIAITHSNINQQLKNIDGVLLPGGDFKTPCKYYTNKIDCPYPDDLDWHNAYQDVLTYCLKNNTPILGICGGMQQLAIALGGMLHLGIKNHRCSNNKQLVHNIKINTNSILYNIFQQEILDINSIHQECVSKISDNILVSAFAEDGTIEAIESKNHHFASGVQWHPECLLNQENSKQSNLFNYFIKQCYKQNKSNSIIKSDEININ